MIQILITRGGERAGACVWLALCMNPTMTAEVTSEGVDRVKTGLRVWGRGEGLHSQQHPQGLKKADAKKIK